MTYELPYGIGSAFTSKAITRRLASSIQCRWLRIQASSFFTPPVNSNLLKEGFGILSSDAYSLQAAPPASCSSRCGSGLCFASVASVMKELTLLQLTLQFIPE